MLLPTVVCGLCLQKNWTCMNTQHLKASHQKKHRSNMIPAPSDSKHSRRNLDMPQLVRGSALLRPTGLPNGSFLLLVDFLISRRRTKERKVAKVCREQREADTSPSSPFCTNIQGPVPRKQKLLQAERGWTHLTYHWTAQMLWTSCENGWHIDTSIHCGSWWRQNPIAVMSPPRKIHLPMRRSVISQLCVSCVCLILFLCKVYVPK